MDGLERGMRRAPACESCGKRRWRQARSGTFTEHRDVADAGVADWTKTAEEIDEDNVEFLCNGCHAWAVGETREALIGLVDELEADDEGGAGMDDQGSEMPVCRTCGAQSWLQHRSGEYTERRTVSPLGAWRRVSDDLNDEYTEFSCSACHEWADPDQKFALIEVLAATDDE